MIRKIAQTLLFVLLFYIVPLVGKPSLMTDPKILVLVVTASIVFLTQPEYRVSEARERADEDRFSIVLILIAAAVSQILPVVEWAYLFHFNTAALSVVGMVLMVSGLVIRLLAIRSLRYLFTGTVHVEDEQPIVTSGVYRIVRHPSYLGAFVTVLGTAAFLQAWVSFVIASVLMAIAYRYRIRQEESVLLQIRSDEYAHYQAQTRWRMIPSVW